MKEKLEFNLTHQMALELIKFNKMKKELVKLNNKDILKNEDSVKIQKLENELNNARNRFIKEFRESNQEEISKYLQMKDQF